MAEPDAVDRIIEQWHRELPDLELQPMAIFGRIHRVSQKLAARLHDVYSELGLGRGEFDVLASIRRSGEPFILSPKQISATLMLSSGGLTGRLDKLEQAGLIERHPDPADRRALKIHLTKQGRHVIETAVRAGQEVNDAALAPLDPEERRQLDALMRKVHAGFEDQPFA
ncbi:MarR family transcriptional regulator [Glycomyces halotolerans]